MNIKIGDVMIPLHKLFELSLIRKIPLHIYLRTKILPMYKGFDAGHRKDHATMVADFAVKLAKMKGLDIDLAYAAGICHDVGLRVDRKTHHLESGKFVRKSTILKALFNKEQLEMMAQAVEDHRASAGKMPRNIYGKILADADKSDFMKLEDWMKRSWKYRSDMHKTHSDEEIFEELFKRMQISFGPKGTVKLILPETKKILGKDLKRTKQFAKDKGKTYKVFLKLRKEGILKK